MVIKRRFRGIALPFMLYLVSGVAAVFFINEAGNGSRGIETRNSLLSEIARLSTELSKVTAERLALERRNALVGKSVRGLCLIAATEMMLSSWPSTERAKIKQLSHFLMNLISVLSYKYLFYIDNTLPYLRINHK